VTQVFNGHAAERARDYFTADVAWHGNTLGTVNGLDTIVPILAGFHRRTHRHSRRSPGRDREQRPRGVASGRQCTAHGNLARHPATGLPVHWDAVDIYRVNDAGKISEQWAFEDLAAVLSQVAASNCRGPGPDHCSLAAQDE